MKSLLRVTTSRQIALLAGAVIGGILALLIYVAISISGLKDDLPLELLDRQHSLYEIFEDLSSLHRMFQSAATEPRLPQLDLIRDKVASTRFHLSGIVWKSDLGGGETAASIHARINPILNDIDAWLSNGFLGLPPESSTVLSAMAHRTLDASSTIKPLIVQAHEEAAAALGRNVSFLEKFRASLIPILVQFLLIGGLFAYFALRAQRMAEANNLAQTRLRDAVESLPVSFSLFDKNAKLVMFNKKHRDIYPGPKEMMVVGVSFSDLLNAATESECFNLGPKETVEWLAARQASFRDKTGPNEMSLADGSILEMIDCPTAEGGTVTICTDVTEARAREADLLRISGELRAAKEEAEMASRSKSEFLANVSHELRTPLNAIIGFSEIIKSELFGPIEPEQYREYAGDIHDSGRHLLSLINDILDLSKVEAGKLEMEETDIDIAEAVEASMRLVRDRAHKGQVKLVNALPSEMPVLIGDLRAIKQILLNLLSNAVKFTGEGGTVTLGAESQADGSFEITVADNGIGMSPSEVTVALTPFGQVDSTFNRRFEGTGLGLPLSQRLILAHGGTLEVRSEPDAGTCVTLRFPADRVQSGLKPAAIRQN